MHFLMYPEDERIFIDKSIKKADACFEALLKPEPI